MEKKVTSVNSIGMFNLAKGILMVSVIAGHSLTLHFHYWEPKYTTQWWYYMLFFLKAIFYGLIPAFFMISGYGFYKKPLRKSVKVRLKHLIKPYIMVSILIVFFEVLKNVIMNRPIEAVVWNQLIPYLFGICPGGFEWNGNYIGSIGPMWFLVALAVASIMLDMIFQLENEAMRGLCVAALVAFATRLPYTSFIPFCVIQSMCCAGYMYIGYLLRENNVLARKLSKQNVILLLVIAGCVMLFGNIEVSQNVWALGALDYLASAIIGFLVLYLFNYMNRIRGKVAGILREIGMNSLFVLCVHTFEYQVFPWQRMQQLFENYVVAGVLITLFIRGAFVTAGVWIVLLCMKSFRRRKRVKRLER